MNYEEERKGAYIFSSDGDIILFIFKSLSPENLKKSLPISYINDSNKKYLTALFDSNNTDYIGQSSYLNIKKNIQKLNAHNLNNNTDMYFLNLYPNLTQTRLNWFREFSQDQLKTD